MSGIFNVKACMEILERTEDSMIQYVHDVGGGKIECRVKFNEITLKRIAGNKFEAKFIHKGKEMLAKDFYWEPLDELSITDFDAEMDLEFTSVIPL